jgi:hypothetical protein
MPPLRRSGNSPTAGDGNGGTKDAPLEIGNGKDHRCRAGRCGKAGRSVNGGPWEVVLFQSVHHALRAEKLLKEAGIPCKLIPIPRNLSSDCGVCLRFDPSLRPRIEEALQGRVETEKILPL